MNGVISLAAIANSRRTLVQPPSGPPAILSSATTSSNGAAAIAQTFNMPAGVQAGDFLMALVCVDADRTLTHSGWTAVASVPNGSGDFRFWVLSRQATGTDGLSVTISAAEAISGVIFRISNSTYAQVVTNAVQSTTNDPPSITFSAGAEDHLVFAGMASGGDKTASSSISGYTAFSTITSGSDGTGARVTWATRSVNAASENPGTFTSVSGQTNRAIDFTVGVGFL